MTKLHFRAQGTVPSTRHPRGMRVTKRPYDNLRAIIAAAEAVSGYTPTVKTSGGVRTCRYCGRDISGTNAAKAGRGNPLRCAHCQRQKAKDYYEKKVAGK